MQFHAQKVKKKSWMKVFDRNSNKEKKFLKCCENWSVGSLGYFMRLRSCRVLTSENLSFSFFYNLTIFGDILFQIFLVTFLYTSKPLSQRLLTLLDFFP